MDNKIKNISDYEKRLLEDRVMLDELVEENYMEGSELVKNKLKYFRQELDYMENQLHFIKSEMKSKAVAENIGTENVEEKNVQKETLHAEDKVDEDKGVVHAVNDEVKQNAEQNVISPQAKEKFSVTKNAKDIEKMIGKSLMGVFASILVFISLILFATLILPYFNNTAKMIITYIVSFAFLGIGLYKVSKEPDNKFYLALTGCGVGALYISLILSNFYFKVIGDIPLYVLIALWGVGVCYLAKYKNQVFQIIGLSGITIALIFGCNLCMDKDDGTKFLALIVFYIVSYGVFYFTHFSKEFYGNLAQNVFGLVNVAYLYITSLNIPTEEIALSKIIILAILVINIGVALYCKIGDAKYSFTIIVPSYILVFILELYDVISNENVYGVIGWLVCVILIAIIEWKNTNYEEGKSVVNSILAVMAFFVLCNNVMVSNHVFVPMIVLPFILLGFYRKNDIYKIVSLFMFSMYVFSGEINVFERSIFGVIVLGTVIGLMYFKKEKSTAIFTVIYHIFTLIFLYYASYQIFAIELRDESVGNMLGFLLSNIFNVVMMKLSLSEDLKIEDDYRLVYKLINTVMMLVGLVLIGYNFGSISHFIIILTTVVVFMINVKNILDNYDGLLAGFYIGGKFTVLLVVILSSFTAPNFIVSIGCFIISIISIICGFKGKYKSLRIYGLILSMISIFKLIMVDINYDNTLGNALSFLASGVLCFAINMIYNYIDKKINEEDGK